MANKVDEAAEQVMREVDRVTDPERMTRAEYGEFLGDVISRLESYREAYEDEERDAEDDDEGDN